MTSSLQNDHCPMAFTGEQLNKQEQRRAKDEGDDDDDDYIIVDQQKLTDQVTTMNNENEIEDEYDQDDEQFTSTRLLDNGQHDGMLSDESQYSDDIRFVFLFLSVCLKSMLRKIFEYKTQGK